MWLGDMEGEIFEGLYSSYCCEIFSYASDFAGEYLSASFSPFYYDETVTAYVKKPDIPQKGFYIESEIVSVRLNRSEAEVGLLEAAVDSQSGLLFDPKKCPQQSYELRYYTPESLPKKYCTKNHKKSFFEWFL